MKYTLRAPAAVLLGVVLLGVGVIGIQASPTCQRFVKTYTEKVTHHPVTKATLARWAEWGKDHPNYHPPAKRRPKLSPQESLSLVNLACEVPVPALTISSTLEPVEPTGLQVDALLVPTELIPPAFSLVGVPVQPAPAPTDEPIPEPSSVLLLGTGIALLVLFRKRLGPSFAN